VQVDGVRLFAYRVVYVGCIIILSLQSAMASRGPTDHHLWLPVVEILAALMFLHSRLESVGLTVLLGVYAVAAATTALSGRIPARFVLYAAFALLLAQLTSGHRRLGADSHSPPG
jgi:hypothetical protein